MKFRITILVFLVILLMGMVESEAYAIRFYCYTCTSIYEVAGSHKDCVSAIKTYPVVQGKKYSQPVVTKTENKFFSFFPIKAYVRIQQRPIGYRIYRQYGRYGNNRAYYNLSGRNYFRKWFGKSHHHRDHHESRRHTHDSHHNRYSSRW